MEFNPVHIHKTKNGSLGKVFLLAVPVMIYILILTFFMYSKSRSNIANRAQDQGAVLGTENPR